MTTPNIEELIEQLETALYDWNSYVQEDTAPCPLNSHAEPAIHDIKQALQSQAERIKKLEFESSTHLRMRNLHYGENGKLRAQLAAIAATEPVAYRWVWKSKPHDIEGWCYTSTPPNSPELQEIEQLFTRPMPAKPQDHEIRELVDRPAILFKPRLFPAGDQWCALLGEDLQTGVCGFGASAGDAMRDFDKEWNTKLKARK